MLNSWMGVFCLKSEHGLRHSLCQKGITKYAYFNFQYVVNTINNGIWKDNQSLIDYTKFPGNNNAKCKINTLSRIWIMDMEYFN